MAIGDNIKKLRLRHGLSQAELAGVAGVSDKAVSTWEQNKAVPRMGPIQRMADYFGVKKSDIIEPSEGNADISPGKRVSKTPTSLNADETKLLSGYRSLNGNNRQAIDVMMALFLSQQSGDETFGSSAMAM